MSALVSIGGRGGERTVKSPSIGSGGYTVDDGLMSGQEDQEVKGGIDSGLVKVMVVEEGTARDSGEADRATGILHAIAGHRPEAVRSLQCAMHVILPCVIHVHASSFIIYAETELDMMGGANQQRYTLTDVYVCECASMCT